MVKQKIKVLIINPHPDDGEAFASQICIQAIKAGWEVHQLLATCDEYGTPDNSFKGVRIRNIRRNEMIRAQHAYGTDNLGIPFLKIHWMDYIDGYVPHNKKAIYRLQRFIKKINPTIIIGPDPFLYGDAHVDHLALGKNYYFALKWMDPDVRPKNMLFFQTLKPDFFIARRFRKIIKKARAAHVSQFHGIELGFIDLHPYISQLFYQLKYGHLKPIEGYRKVVFDSSAHLPTGIAKLVFISIFKDRPLGCEPGRLLPLPEKLGLNRIPLGDIL